MKKPEDWISECPAHFSRPHLLDLMAKIQLDALQHPPEGWAVLPLHATQNMKNTAARSAHGWDIPNRSRSDIAMDVYEEIVKHGPTYPNVVV